MTEVYISIEMECTHSEITWKHSLSALHIVTCLAVFEMEELDGLDSNRYIQIIFDLDAPSSILLKIAPSTLLRF